MQRERPRRDSGTYSTCDAIQSPVTIDGPVEVAGCNCELDVGGSPTVAPCGAGKCANHSEFGMAGKAMNNPVHPGAIVREECLKPLRRSVTNGARRLDVGRQTLSNLVNEKVPVSIEMSYRLPKAFESTPETWLGMQRAFDLARSRHLEGEINMERIASARTSLDGQIGLCARRLEEFRPAQKIAGCIEVPMGTRERLRSARTVPCGCRCAGHCSYRAASADPGARICRELQSIRHSVAPSGACGRRLFSAVHHISRRVRKQMTCWRRSSGIGSGRATSPRERDSAQLLPTRSRTVCARMQRERIRNSRPGGEKTCAIGHAAWPSLKPQLHGSRGLARTPAPKRNDAKPRS